MEVIDQTTNGGPHLNNGDTLSTDHLGDTITNINQAQTISAGE